MFYSDNIELLEESGEVYSITKEMFLQNIGIITDMEFPTTLVVDTKDNIVVSQNSIFLHERRYAVMLYYCFQSIRHFVPPFLRKVVLYQNK